jgi:2-dehydro-3-deoxyphosphogluconate aldolase/(4S)-4-hydroxy-2-oxoglutarate aldolase
MTTTCFTRPAFTSRIVPVIVLDDASHAVPLAHALLEGGIDVMEITLRSSVALQSMEAVARDVPQMHLGAGTVTRVSEVAQVIAAGASFALSPGCTDELVQAVHEANLPFIPGVMTPSEVMRGAQPWLHPHEAVPRHTGRWSWHAQGAGRAAARCAFLPHRRRECGESARLSETPQRGDGGWLVAHTDQPAAQWRLVGITRLARDAIAQAAPN